MKDRTTVGLAIGETSHPFRYEHSLILFDGQGLAGLPLVVELDTCTSPNVVRDALVAENFWPVGAEMEADGILAKSSAREAEVPLIRLGELSISDLYAHTDPLGGPGSPDVMLGERFLREVTVQVDYAHRRATFFAQDQWQPLAGTRGRVVLDLAAEVGGIPCLRDQARLNGAVHVPTTLLDTGFNDTVLLSPLIADAIGMRPGAPGVVSVTGGGYGGAATVWRGQVAELQLGPFRMHDIPVYRPSAGAEAPFLDPAWVLVGNRVFEKFLVTWSVPRGVFAIELPPASGAHVANVGIL